jgi:hypothetical protein
MQLQRWVGRRMDFIFKCLLKCSEHVGRSTWSRKVAMKRHFRIRWHSFVIATVTKINEPIIFLHARGLRVRLLGHEDGL